MRNTMRDQRKRAYLSAAAAAALAGACALQLPSAAPAAAVNYEWAGGDTVTPTSWDLTSLNWNDLSTPATGVAWSNNVDPTTPNAAFFPLTATPGTVTVNAGIDLATLSFSAGAWTIAGGTGDLSFGSNGGNIAVSTVGNNTLGATIVDRTAATSISVGGAGVLTLTGTNTYSGNTTLNGGGTLAIDDLARIGAGNIDFNGGWLQVNGTGLTTVDGRIAAGETTARIVVNDAANVFTMNTALAAGTGVLQAKGPGVLVVSGQNLNTGTTDLSTGAIMRLAGGDNRLNPVANIVISEASTLDLNGVNQEVARIDSTTTAVAVTNSAAATTSTFTIGGLANATYDGQINDGAGAGVIALVKNGTATQTLNGTSSYSGGTTINGGTLSVNSNAALGAATGDITFSGGATLSSTTGFALGTGRDVTLGTGGGTLANATVDTVLAVDGVVSGSDLARNTTAGAVALTNSNTYTGLTTINGVNVSTGDDATSKRGGLIAAANDALGTTAGGTTINGFGWLGFQGGVNYTTAEPVTIAAAGQVTGSIRNIGGNNTFAGAIAAGANALSIGVDADSLRLSGSLTGTAGLTKVGAGTLILSSPQAYTGTTTLRLATDAGSGRSVTTPAGTLKLENAATLPGQLTLAASGSVVIESTGSLTRGTTLQVGQNGRLTVNALSGSTTDTFNGALNSREGGGEPIIEINPAAGQVSTVSFTAYDRVNLGNSSAAGGTVNFRGPNFGKGVGADEARVTFVTTVPALSSNIVKTFTITDTATGLTRFATNGANGIRQLLDTEYNGGTAVNGLSPQNARLTAGTTTSIAGDVNPGSLTLEGNNVTLNSTAAVGGIANLRIGTSNGVNSMLSVGTGNVISTTTLDSGSISATAVDEMIVYVEGDLTINSVIRNATGATTAPHLAITKTGPGELVLAGDNTFISTETSANKFLRINNGTVSFTTTGMDASGVADGSPKNLGQWDGSVPGGRISLMGSGGLHLKGEDRGTVFVPQAIHISNNGLAAVDATTAFIEVDAGTTLKTAGIKQYSGNGPGGFTKKGAGTLELFGGTASGITFDRTGTGKSYLADGALTLSGDAANYGGLQASGWLVASPGTTINLNSAARPTNTSTRLGNVQLTGSRLNVTGNSANATTDQIGTFVFAAGGSEVAITQGTGQTTALNASNTAGSVRRRQGGTAVFSGAGLGTAATGVARITGSGQFNGSNVGGVIPWALADTTVGGPGTAFAVYNSTNGITAVTSNTGSIASGGNVRLSASDAGSGTVNSLHLDGNELSAGSAGGTLNVTSGGILSTGGANAISAATLNFGAREGVIHTVTNLSVSGVITGSAGLTKAGPNLLTLSGDNTYAGGTHINDGYLMVNNATGSATGSGFVSINRGTLIGSGNIAGAVTASRDAEIAPGITGVGAIHMGGLTLEPGSLLSVDLAATNSSDFISVAAAGGLTLNGGSVALNDAGGMTAGTYTLIDYTAAFNGSLANLGTPTGPAGFNYALVDDTTATAIKLIVSPIGPVESVWNRDDSVSLWSASSSWTGGVPNANGALASFGSVITAAQTVNVDGTQTVGRINFDNNNSYTLAAATPGGGSIVIDRDTAIAEINVINGSHAITAPVTLNKETTVTVTGETNTLTISDLQPSSVNVTKQGGGTLVVNNVRANDLAVTTGTLKMIADPGPTGVSQVAALTIGPEGKLDLNANKLLTSTPAGTFDGTAYNGVQGDVQRAYDFGAWDLPGLTTSQENAGQNAGPLSGTTTIGVATAEQVLFIGATETTVVFGQTVTGATTIAMYTYAGDVNFDGLVDGADYGTLDNWIQFPGTSGYANGDVNYDGVIDGADYGVLDNSIQLQGDPFPGVFSASGSGAASLAGVTAVPEPSACGFAILAGAALLGRRRRRGNG